MQFGPQKSETNNFELFLMEWPAKKQFQKTRAEGMQFYCPSRTYPAIPYHTQIQVHKKSQFFRVNLKNHRKLLSLNFFKPVRRGKDFFKLS